MNRITATCLLLCVVLFPCCHPNGPGHAGPAFPDRPSREADEGFRWEIVSGAGLKFWAQHNAHIRIVTDENIPGARIERTDGTPGGRTVMRLFPLENGKIEDVLQTLRTASGRDAPIACSFREAESGRTGVKRYILVPSGKETEAFDRNSPLEPIPSTCGGWGVGNSGMRYFEIHDNKPDIALFVEIGQEAPLFDERSIVLTDDAEATGDPLRTVEGTLVIGHEVRSLTVDGDSVAHWVTDETGTLYEKYDEITGGIKNGTPVHVRLKVREAGRPDEGFAAGYAGVYHVTEIIRIEK